MRVLKQQELLKKQDPFTQTKGNTVFQKITGPNGANYQLVQRTPEPQRNYNNSSNGD